MSPAAAAPHRANHLLASLPPAECERVAQACERVELVVGQVLMTPGARLGHAWFPLDAVVSVRAQVAKVVHGLEVALVGREGLVGVPLLLGATVASVGATVVIAGAALRLAAAPLRLHLHPDGAFRRRMHDYVLVALAQTTQGVLCMRYHRVDERLARWLLMTQDRATLELLPLTHEFLATTLGVRRAGVTRAAASLQLRQLIAYRRGMVVILDRAGLEGAACSCYAADRVSYAQLMRPLAT